MYLKDEAKAFYHQDELVKKSISALSKVLIERYTLGGLALLKYKKTFNS